MPFAAPDVAIDLGTARTRVYVKNVGVIIDEPTIVAHQADNRKNVHYVGEEARRLLGRTREQLVVSSPIRSGVVVDFDLAAFMMRDFLRKAIGNSYLIRPRLLISVPPGLSEVNRKVVREAGIRAGAKKVILIDKTFAAAMGSGLHVTDPEGSMVVDIGAGTTDVAVVSMGGTVVAQSVQVGSEKLDDAIAGFIRREFKMEADRDSITNVKHNLASAMQLTTNRETRVTGRDTLSPQPMVITFNSYQAFEAVREPCRAILAAIQYVLTRTPAELSADIMKIGIHLTGGGSRLFALDQYIAVELGLPVQTANRPEESTVTGMGFLIENPELLARLA